MTKEASNIELRSEKVRNIIGQIPPRLVSIGMSVIFFVFALILVGAYFFEYDYTIKTSAKLFVNKNLIECKIEIPANQVKKVKSGQKVILSFDNIPNMYGQRLMINLSEIIDTIQVTAYGGNYFSRTNLSKTIKTEANNPLQITEQLVVNAEIYIGKIRFFDRIFEPIKSVFAKRK